MVETEVTGTCGLSLDETDRFNVPFAFWHRHHPMHHVEPGVIGSRSEVSNPNFKQNAGY